MQMYRVKATVSNDGMVTIKELPFRAGDNVEVVVRGYWREGERSWDYPLRGKPIRYLDPFKSVAEDDWNVLQ